MSKRGAGGGGERNEEGGTSSMKPPGGALEREVDRVTGPTPRIAPLHDPENPLRDKVRRSWLALQEGLSSG